MSSPLPQIRASLMGAPGPTTCVALPARGSGPVAKQHSLVRAAAVFALAAALASCGWDTPESALHDTGASTDARALLAADPALLAADSARAAAHRFGDDYPDALRLLADQVPDAAAPSF